MSKEIKVTKEQLINAYEAWESDNRLSPSLCMSLEEMNKQDIRDIATLNTSTLLNYLNKSKSNKDT